MANNQKISRVPWPWGRKSPEKKLEEIQKAISAQLVRKKVIEDQAREAQRNTDLKIQELKRQQEFVAGCVHDAHRARNKELAYRLEEFGIQAIQMVEDEGDQESLTPKLEKMLKEAENRSPDSERRIGDGVNADEDVISENELRSFFN